MDNTAGTKITDIPNREFIQLTTNNAEKIIRGLDMSGILFFAKYNGTSLSLAYDGSRKDSVNEIINKAESGDYEVIEREFFHDKPKCYERLLPEIADMLNVSIAQLRVSKALSDRLIGTYINNWYADRYTIQSKLGEFVDLSYTSVIERKSGERQREFFAAAPERSEKQRQTDTEHKQAVMQGDEDHRIKEETVKKEEKHFFFSGRSNVVKNMRSFVSSNENGNTERTNEEERQRIKP